MDRPRCKLLLNTFMRYQIFDDDLGNYLIVDTWRQYILAKATTKSMGARICQKLNKKLGDEIYFKKFTQNILTYR